MNPAEVAAVLRGQAKAVELARPIPDDYSWRTGIVPEPASLSPLRRAVDLAARRACGAWAWACRRSPAHRRTFAGHTHARQLGTWQPMMPWHRLNAFVAFSANLPGAKGMPGGSAGDRWTWAMLTAADWIDAGMPPKLPEEDGPVEDLAGGPEPDPLDRRYAVWIGKRIYVGDNTDVAKLFWLLAQPLGRPRLIGEVQRAVEGYETHHGYSSQKDCRRSSQRIRKVASVLRGRIRDAGLENRLLVGVRGGGEGRAYVLFDLLGRII